jgi:hypothetical protein
VRVTNYHFPLGGVRDYFVLGDPDTLARYLMLQTYIEVALVLSAWGAIRRDFRKLFIFMSIARLLVLFWVDSTELIPVNQITCVTCSQ